MTPPLEPLPRQLNRITCNSHYPMDSKFGTIYKTFLILLELIMACMHTNVQLTLKI